MDIVTYAMAVNCIKKSLDGLGVLKGAACTIKSITETDDGNIVTFEWTGDSGAKQTRTMTVKNGVGITAAEVDANGHLIFTMSDGETIDCGEVGGDAKLKESLTATESIGNVTSGKTYPAHTELETIIRDMLIKYFPPAVTITTDPATKLYDIVTDKINAIQLKAAVTKKTEDVTKVSFYRGNTLLNEITSGVTAGGNFTYNYTPDVPIDSDVTFKATATDGQQQNTSTVTIKFVGRSYYGICDASVTEPDETVIKSGSNTLKDTRNFKYTGITTEWGKVFYAYPKSFGALTYIKDDINNINYWESFTATEVQVDGILYYCYTLNEATAADDNEITFK